MPELSCLPFPVGDKSFGFALLPRRDRRLLVRCVGQSIGFDGQIVAGMLYSAKLLRRVFSEALPDPVKTVLK